ncbi:hypothetical protein TNIN_388691 [Trichonephila inaurata madagascariensis]|uniref:Uncharacterized protein n=1 Tax=Trichonephila inaurata madagascariensis TaxID=2747483 RepID=A0A8X6IAL4_9ARAC|nr:hypothetical protein TNIN_388691 [Trichonephila inaurata madagascariensis]
MFATHYPPAKVISFAAHGKRELFFLARSLFLLDPELRLVGTDYFSARDLLLDSVLLGQKAVRRQLAWDLHPSSQTTLSKTTHGECLWMNIQSRAATVINRALLSMPRVDFDTILKELCEDTAHQTFEKIYVPTYSEVCCPN